MTGSVSFAKDELGKKVDTYVLKYILPELPKKPSNGVKDKDKTKFDEYTEALRDLKTNWLGKLGKDSLNGFNNTPNILHLSSLMYYASL